MTQLLIHGIIGLEVELFYYKEREGVEMMFGFYDDDDREEKGDIDTSKFVVCPECQQRTAFWEVWRSQYHCMECKHNFK